MWVYCNFPEPIGNSRSLLTCHYVLVVCILNLTAGSLVTMCVLESYVILEAAPTFYPDLNNLSIMAFVDRPAMVKAPPFQGINSDFRVSMNRQEQIYLHCSTIEQNCLNPPALLQVPGESPDE